MRMILGTEGGSEPVIAGLLPNNDLYVAIKHDGGYARAVIPADACAVIAFADLEESATEGVM